MSASDDEGFSIVEVLIAMFLLFVIAVSLMPALFNGIRLSSEQSATATATRALNALVEEARQSPSCSGLSAVAVSRTVKDGAGGTITTSGVVGTCPSVSKTVKLTLQAVDSGGDTLASTTAIVYVP